MAKRRVQVTEGYAAVRAVLGGDNSRSSVATAVRYLLEELAERAPGNSVEVRVPPFGATQCIEGPRHTRGTPANVVEFDAATWISLATGSLSWSEGIEASQILASGSRAHLDGLLPLFALATPGE